MLSEYLGLDIRRWHMDLNRRRTERATSGSDDDTAKHSGLFTLRRCFEVDLLLISVVTDERSDRAATRKFGAGQ
jgi:hypothetical protein